MMPKRAGAARLSAIPSRQYNQIIERFEQLGTWAWDVNSGVMRWSEGLRRSLGHDTAGLEHSAETMIAATHPDDRWTMQEMLRETPLPAGADVRLKSSNGVYRWFACHREVFHPEPDSPIVIAVMHDITDVRLANSLVQQRGRLLASMLALLDGMMWRSRCDGTVEFDVGWCEFTGTSLAENRGEGWLRSIHPDDRAGALATWSHAVETRSLYSTNYRVKRHDGQYRRFNVRASPLFGEDAEVLEWVGYCAPDQSATKPPVAVLQSSGRPTPAETRAARGFLNWSVRTLSEQSGVSTATLSRYENSPDGGMRAANVSALRKAFEAVGVTFEARQDGGNLLAFQA